MREFIFAHYHRGGKSMSFFGVDVRFIEWLASIYMHSN
ncbi:MAG: hypothetical protein ACI9WC_000578 [Arenicella sp.]|jgi:hypothetical protein